MKFETFTIEIMECFATYISYGDDSHMHTTEALCADGKLDKLAQDYPGYTLHIESEHNEFGRCEWLNLHGATMTVTVHYPVYASVA